MKSTITVSGLIYAFFLQCKIKNKLNLRICYTKYSVRSMTAFISSLTVLDSYIEGKKKASVKVSYN